MSNWKMRCKNNSVRLQMNYPGATGTKRSLCCGLTALYVLVVLLRIKWDPLCKLQEMLDED